MNTITTEKAPVDVVTELFRDIFQEIATTPDKIEIKVVPFGYGTKEVNIYCDATDFGKLLGGKQAHLKAYKVICKMVSDQTGENIQVKLNEIAGGQKREMPPFRPREAWEKDRIRALVEKLALVLFGRAAVVITDAANGYSALDILTSRHTQAQTISWLKLNLEPLIKAIGLKHGRMFYFNIVQNDQALSEVMLQREAA